MTKLMMLMYASSNIGNNAVVVDDINNQNIVLNSNYSQEISLTTQKMNSVNLDLNYLEKDLSKDELKEEINLALSSEIVSTNSEKEWIDDFFESYLDKPDSWKTLGIKYEIPKENTNKKAKVKIMPNKVEGFKGVMSVDVTILNSNENSPGGGGETNPPIEDNRIDLKTKLKGLDLGNIIDPNQKKIIEKLEDFDEELTLNDIVFEKITYDLIKIRAKEDSEIFKGKATIKYNGKMGSVSSDLKTERIQIEKYSGESWKNTVQSEVYHTQFGKENFISKFSKIKINASGFSWNNHDGDRNHPIETSISILETKSTQVFDRIYSNVNWMKAYGFISTSWINDKDFKIELKVEVGAYATAWNAYWAKTAASLKLNSFTFE